MTPREGTNLIVTEGETWLRQRKALSAPFRPRALQAADPVFQRATAQAVQSLTEREGHRDVFPVMAAASREVMVDLALGGREVIDRDALTRSVDEYVAGLGRVFLLDLILVPNWVPRPAALFEISRKRMDDLADRVIAQRCARGPSDDPDLLDLLIEAEAAGTLDALEVRNNLLGFLFAGHETTALSLTWALYLLALSPDVQGRLRAEVGSICGDRAPALRDVSDLVLTRQVIDDALRLYPPAGVLTRTARADDMLAGHKIKRGASVILPVYALHRHEMHWDAPNAFRPERFETEVAKNIPRSAYLPFGDGLRICVGASMAVMEATLILASVIQKVSVSLPAGDQPKPVIWFTLRPESGMQLDVTPIVGASDGTV